MKSEARKLLEDANLEVIHLEKAHIFPYEIVSFFL